MKKVNISQESASVFRKFSWFWVLDFLKPYFTSFWDWFLQTPVMKRMKRFVLAERSEKNPIWKSSDNLLTGIVRINSENNDEKELFKLEPSFETEKAAGLT